MDPTPASGTATALIRRGRQIIQPYAQLQFGLVFLFLNTVFATGLFAIFAYYLWDVFEAITVYYELTQRERLQTWEKFLPPVLWCLSLVTTFILASLWLSVRYTHRFYGPLVSIERALRQIAAGQRPTPIKLREGDQLQQMTALLNRLHHVDTPQQICACLDAIVRGETPKLPAQPASGLYAEIIDHLTELAAESTRR